MQRIDENTYIDDTLVTCAEYQLFIDEMREQGKYYQPDHWTTYQFPVGQAKEPILGVRPNDTVAFCEWLTKHEMGEWRYRPPTIEETSDHPIKSSQRPLGYWVWDTDIPQIILIGDADTAGDSIRSNLALLIKNILTVANVTETARIANRDFEKDMDIELDLNRTLNIVKDIENDILGLVFPPDFSPNTTVTLSLVRDLIISLDIVCHRGSDENRDINLLIPDAIKIVQEIDNTREYVLEQGSNYFRLTVELELILTVSLLACVHLFTLRERIAGHSPAFEGIRLVKERIR